MPDCDEPAHSASSWEVCQLQEQLRTLRLTIAQLRCENAELKKENKALKTAATSCQEATPDSSTVPCCLSGLSPTDTALQETGRHIEDISCPSSSSSELSAGEETDQEVEAFSRGASGAGEQTDAQDKETRKDMEDWSQSGRRLVVCLPHAHRRSGSVAP
ncbi:unnamed protein product [Symbiodinium pilosum]|uniref:Uncharacterized protein n=1 Tax=Symbiodinium pilosum TaxID=2952 RepID=A0A812XXD0_SYMPI|nr:unnamed protein product [Symbiodinium pilosum]